MNITDFAALIGAITGAASLLSIIYVFAVKFARLETLIADVEKLEALHGDVREISVKTDTLWDFQLRRGAVEAKRRGFGEQNSPLVLNKTARVLMRSMEADLRSYYATLDPSMHIRELSACIERVFGDRLVREICIPADIDQGACLLMAVAAATGSWVLDLPEGARGGV